MGFKNERPWAHTFKPSTGEENMRTTGTATLGMKVSALMILLIGLAAVCPVNSAAVNLPSNFPPGPNLELPDLNPHEWFKDRLDQPLPVYSDLHSVAQGEPDNFMQVFKNTSTSDWTDFHIKIFGAQGGAILGIVCGDVEFVNTCLKGGHLGCFPLGNDSPIALGGFDSGKTVFNAGFSTGGIFTVSNFGTEATINDTSHPVHPGDSFSLGLQVLSGFSKGAYRLTVQASAPEPSTFVLVSTAALAVVVYARRKTSGRTRQ
jgi:hypothetical protein